MKLRHYIQGNRKGKEAHRIEKEAMHDPFLSDALEGFEQVKGDHARQIEQLSRQITRSSKRRAIPMRAWSIAASLLIVIGTGTWFLIREVEMPPVPDIDLYAVTFEEEQLSLEEPKLDATAEEVSPGALATAAPLPQAKKKEKVSAAVAAMPIMEAEQAEELEDSLAEDSAENSMEDRAEVSAIILDEAKVMARQKTLQAMAVTPGKVKGKVTDNAGDPLVGASIRVQGTNRGTVSDLEGDFELSTNSGEKIEIEYIGYDPVMFAADTSQIVHIALHENQDLLSEAVVVGYGSQKKKSRSIDLPRPVKGERSYEKYLRKNLKYPSDDCKEVKGEVILVFLVNEQGRPYDISIRQSLCPSADQEAIRLVNEGPDWKEGVGVATVTVKF